METMKYLLSISVATFTLSVTGLAPAATIQYIDSSPSSFCTPLVYSKDDEGRTGEVKSEDDKEPECD